MHSKQQGDQPKGRTRRGGGRKRREGRRKRREGAAVRQEVNKQAMARPKERSWSKGTKMHTQICTGMQCCG